MKRYSEYKDSGVKWIGEIPKHWKIESFSRHFTYGKGLPITKADLKEKGIAVISYGQIHAKYNSGTSMTEALVRRVDQSFLITNPQSLLAYNDFVFADTSEDIKGSGNCCYNDYDDKIFAGYHTVVARPCDLQYPKYYAYLFQSSSWKIQVQSLVNGVKVYSINKSILKKSSLLFPSKDEQTEIVSYLDSKVAKIDRYISTAKKKIAALDELKQVTIADAVTHGINPKAKMKDSGIPWIGMVPEHWKVRKMKFLFNEISEKGHPNETCLCSTQKYGVIPQSMYENRVVVVNKGLENLKFVRIGNFVISLRSFQGGIEMAHYQGIISAAYTVLALANNKLAHDYVKFLFKSNQYIQLLQTCVTGIREGQNINYELLRKQFLPLPPLSEQNSIVSYIDRKVAQIDKMRSAELSQIEKLKEYKQRLISDVVTGKVKVTND